MADDRLGVIAGGGALPRLLLADCVAKNRPCFAVAFRGHTDPATVDSVPHMWARLGKTGTTIRRLKREGVTDIVMAGGMRRPSFAELVPDFYTVRFFARLGRKALGDDGFLRAVSRVFESEGFRVVGIQDVVPDLLAVSGRFGTIEPDAQHNADIEHGFRVAYHLGQLDIGQSVVVQQGFVLAVEAVEGTDALIVRAGSLVKSGSRPVLVKRAKPQQDVRFDLPAIGIETVRNAAAADFAGIAIEAGHTLVVDMAAIALEADRLGLFVVAVDVSA
jgi:DUF1009 family protein